MATRKLNGFFPNEHTFYDNLVTMLMSLSSYLFTLQCSKLTNRPKEYSERTLQEFISYIRPVVDPEHFLTLEIRSLEQYYIFYPFWIITHISLNGWPQYVEYKFAPDPPGKSIFKVDSENNAKIISQFVGSSFISYFESQRDTVCDKFSGNHQDWPDTLNFARHVRNGFAHGGKFSIRNSNTPSVGWTKWQISPSLNNTSVLFDDDGLGIGDVVRLMEDVDKLLK